mmetsp:Transcript_17091/g.28612  ORF Transcript_17091/g.28612 Transcript_17091/m.28612 type:complete len:177 (-) Transcript_17091:486-1016(-)
MQTFIFALLIPSILSFGAEPVTTGIESMALAELSTLVKNMDKEEQMDLFGEELETEADIIQALEKMSTDAKPDEGLLQLESATDKCTPSHPKYSNREICNPDPPRNCDQFQCECPPTTVTTSSGGSAQFLCKYWAKGWFAATTICQYNCAPYMCSNDDFAPSEYPRLTTEYCTSPI